MKQLTILHIATALNWRGGEQQVAYLMRALREKGIRQFMLCSTGSEMEKFCQQEQIPHFTKLKKGGFNPAYARKIKLICMEKQVDLIHTHDSHAHSFAVKAAVVYKNKTKIIVSRRVDFPVSKGFLSRFKYNHSNIARIICVSNMIMKLTAPAIKDPSKLITIHSGVDLSRFEGKSGSGILHREFKIPFSMKLIGNIAALAPHKDYFTFIDTVSMIIEKRNDCKFIIIGDGSEKDKIKNYIHDKNLNEHIIMTGFRTDIPDILPELDVMLITSETEGLGTSILDAFACRVPVVATAAGGIPEIVLDGRTGLLAPVKDSVSLALQVSRILDEKGLGEKLAEGAWNLVSAFTWEATAEKTLDEYRKIIH